MALSGKGYNISMGDASVYRDGLILIGSIPEFPKMALILKNSAISKPETV